MENWIYKNFTIHQFEELGSTNSYAFEQASFQRISDHEIIFAESQSNGKGRQNRHWVSPKGNLYFSIVLKPKVTIDKIPQLSFVGILSLRNAIEKIFIKQTNSSNQKTSPALIKVKWPNDLLINEQKISGILLESKLSNQNTEFVILGIGLNLVSNPDNTIFPATNLKKFNIKISSQEALEIFLDEFEILYQNWLDFGFDNIRKLWLKNAYRLKEKINVKLGEELIEGIFEDLDKEGNLILKSNGKNIKISAADIL